MPCHFFGSVKQGLWHTQRKDESPLQPRSPEDMGALSPSSSQPPLPRLAFSEWVLSPLDFGHKDKHPHSHAPPSQLRGTRVSGHGVHHGSPGTAAGAPLAWGLQAWQERGHLAAGPAVWGSFLFWEVHILYLPSWGWKATGPIAKTHASPSPLAQLPLTPTGTLSKAIPEGPKRHLLNTGNV